MNFSVYKKIFEHLLSKGYNVKSPSTAINECKEKYIVLKRGGGTKSLSFSTNYIYYDLLLYVPKENYSELDLFIDEVKRDMKELYPLVKESGIETPSYYDDNYKAHMVSISYTNNKKI